MTDQVPENATTESTDIHKIVEEDKPVQHVKERRRDQEERLKKKDDKKAAEQLLKGLNDAHSSEDKLGAMCKKYAEVLDENRKLQSTLKQYDKRMLALQREKDQLQGEHNKALLIRERLGSLCRELQKQNKAIKEESLLKIREQEQIRRKLSEQFRGNLAQVKTVMNANIDKSTKMYEEYLKMNKTFETVHQEVQLTEHQFLNVQKRMKLALEDAKEDLAVVKAEKDALLKENEGLLLKLTECQAQITEMQQTEAALRNQITIYTDKYEDFQKALMRSDKISGEFTEEMTLMSKKILMLEEETSLWKKRWENIHSTLLEMAADKQAKDTEMASLRKKLQFLQNLCRAFQRERATLMAQLQKREEKDGESKPNKSPEPDSLEVEKAIEQAEELSQDTIKKDKAVEPKPAPTDESKVAEAPVDEFSVKSVSQEQAAVPEAVIKKASESDTKVEDKEPKFEGEEVIPVAQVESSSNDVPTGQETKEADRTNPTPSVEGPSADSLEEKTKEITTSASSSTEEDVNKELNEKMERFQDEIKTVHTETETILEHLYEAIESVKPESESKEVSNNKQNSTNDNELTTDANANPSTVAGNRNDNDILVNNTPKIIENNGNEDVSTSVANVVNEKPPTTLERTGATDKNANITNHANSLPNTETCAKTQSSQRNNQVHTSEVKTKSKAGRRKRK